MATITVIEKTTKNGSASTFGESLKIDGSKVGAASIPTKSVYCHMPFKNSVPVIRRRGGDRICQCTMDETVIVSSVLFKSLVVFCKKNSLLF